MRRMLSLLLAATFLLSAAGSAASGDDGLPTLSFHTLSCFKCTDSLSGPDGRPIAIPRSLQKLSGRKVAVVGFLVPMQLSNGTCTAFALCRDRGYCCYGVTPNINEVILCEVRPGQHCDVRRDTPTRVCGTLEVGARFANGDLLSIYRMVVDSTTEIGWK